MCLNTNLVELLTKLLLAALFGGIIGFERGLKRKQAGVRTHMLIAIGACLFVSLGLAVAAVYPKSDPSRIISQIIMGIGFLGGGAIIRSGESVGGLTSAAAIWVVAAIGCLVGFGLYCEAGLTTAFVFIVLLTLAPFERKALHKLRALRKNKKEQSK